jgi:hypothetical protein
MGRDLLAELTPLGYTGSLTNLQRFLNPWRRAQFLAVAGLAAPRLAAPRNESPAHPAVPPIAAAALCIKPRGQLTEEQAAKVDMLKATSTEFASMRGLAMRFRGILKGADPGKLDPAGRRAEFEDPLHAPVRHQTTPGCRRRLQRHH